MSKVHERLAEIPAAQLGRVVVAVVEDPYSTNGGQIAVLRQTRDDPLAGLLARNQIDLAQFSAGRAWQRHWEDAAIGAVRGIDPTKEPVDGKGAPVAAFSDRQRKAFLELRLVAATLGFEGNRIVHLVLAERLSLADAAERLDKPAKFMGQRFRECLETLAKLWCFA